MQFVALDCKRPIRYRKHLVEIIAPLRGDPAPAVGFPQSNQYTMGTSILSDKACDKCPTSPEASGKW
jgi:hypothetical protein